MLLNSRQKEQFKLDYVALNHQRLQQKYGASIHKINELAVYLGLCKPIGRPKGSKDSYFRNRKYK